MDPIDFATSPSGQQIPIVDPDNTGFNGLTAEDFIELLVVQLQNQDPTEPFSNEQLLGQISDMRNLQANIDLSDTLEALGNAQLSSAFTTAAGSLIGKSVSATDADGNDIQGVADRAVFRDGKTFIGIGSTEVPIENVSTIQAQPEAA